MFLVCARWPNRQTTYFTGRARVQYWLKPLIFLYFIILFKLIIIMIVMIIYIIVT